VPSTTGSLTLILPSLSRKIIVAPSWRFVSRQRGRAQAKDFERLAGGGRCTNVSALFGQLVGRTEELLAMGPSGHLGLEALAIRWHWHPIALAGDYTGARAAPDSMRGRHQCASCFRASSK
jgi:hypothetical protein